MTDAVRLDQQIEQADDRRKWVVPAVRSLRAGAAEDGSGGIADGAQPS